MTTTSHCCCSWCAGGQHLRGGGDSSRLAGPAATHMWPSRAPVLPRYFYTPVLLFVVLYRSLFCFFRPATCPIRRPSGHKTRRGVVQSKGGVKLRPWMAEPLVVKDGDASLRLVTDLPRFNWLELKYNATGSSSAPTTTTTTTTTTTSNKRPIAQPIAQKPTAARPLKVRILAMNNSKESVPEAPATTAPPPLVAATKRSEPDADLPDQRWPLKKRLLRQDSQPSPTTPPSPSHSPGRLIINDSNAK